jgi:uncharacterized Zn-binding protein involved in type VI secretion
MRALVLAAFAALLVAVAVPARAARELPAEKPIRTIAIVVNGEPLQGDDQPLVVGGRVLVPLRDVFAALGIAVTRSGATLTSRLPTGEVSVSVGSSVAVVNGRTVSLDAPVTEIGGQTYGPLQLLVAAFGAQANYDRRGSRVEIVSAFIGRNGGAEQQRADGGTDVQGVVSAIDQDSTPPSLTVVRGGVSRTVSITSDAKIWTEDVTIHSQLRGQLADVRVGDAVHAILAKDGRVVSVFDFFKSTSGTVSAVSPSALVLQNGRVITPGPGTEITLNSAAAKLGDLRVGDYVTVRGNPESGEEREIVASRSLALETPTAPPAGSAPPVTIASVTISATRPLRAGEELDVALRGTPGGRAAFDIGDYLTGLPMQETTPGNYSGKYVIPERFDVTQVPVYGELAVGTARAPRTEAAATLSAATTPPSIGEVAPPPGQTVNNAQPSIFATFTAPTSIAINVSSIALEVNGHDVTASSTRFDGFVTYSPGVPLPSGPVSVVVRVADAAGNTATKSWTFTIRAAK